MINAEWIVFAVFVTSLVLVVQKLVRVGRAAAETHVVEEPPARSTSGNGWHGNHLRRVIITHGAPICPVEPTPSRDSELIRGDYGFATGRHWVELNGKMLQDLFGDTVQLSDHAVHTFGYNLLDKGIHWDNPDPVPSKADVEQLRGIAKACERDRCEVLAVQNALITLLENQPEDVGGDIRLLFRRRIVEPSYQDMLAAYNSYYKAKDRYEKSLQQSNGSGSR